MLMSANKKLIYRFWVGFLSIIFLITILPQEVTAGNLIDLDRQVSLTIDYQYQDMPGSGVEFSLYKVGDMSVNAEFTLTDMFKEYSVSLDDLDSEGWKALASTLAGYIVRDGLTPIDSSITDQGGLAHFPNKEDNLQAGLYLVIGQESIHGGYTYKPEPFLISLPNKNVSNQWEYSAIAIPKYDSSYNPPGGEDGDTISRKVLKVWKDDDYENQRPEEIFVQLLRDGDVYETVALKQSNNWRHTWTDLDNDYQWQLVEKDVPSGYTVSSKQEGITFVITNTYKPPKPGKPIDPIDPVEPTLPQTGMLWWPVPLLALVGMFIFLIGWIRQHKGRDLVYGKKDRN